MKNFEPWQSQAACQGVDTNLFYPIEKTQRASDRAYGLTREEERAIVYCRRCPVLDNCLRDALSESREEDHGIRGGLPRRKRLKIRNRLGIDDRRVKISV